MTCSSSLALHYRIAPRCSLFWRHNFYTLLSFWSLSPLWYSSYIKYVQWGFRNVISLLPTYRLRTTWTFEEWDAKPVEQKIMKSSCDQGTQGVFGIPTKTSSLRIQHSCVGLFSKRVPVSLHSWELFSREHHGVMLLLFNLLRVNSFMQLHYYVCLAFFQSIGNLTYYVIIFWKGKLDCLVQSFLYVSKGSAMSSAPRHSGQGDLL